MDGKFQNSNCTKKQIPCMEAQTVTIVLCRVLIHFFLLVATTQLIFRKLEFYNENEL